MKIIELGKIMLNQLTNKCLAAIRNHTLQELYEKEAADFEDNYNKNHPDSKIIRIKHREKNGKPPKEHLRYFWDPKNHTYVVAYIVLIRFRRINPLPGESKSFTFYGTMFVKGSKYSKQFMLSAILEPNVYGPSGNSLAVKTIERWKAAFSHYIKAILTEEGLDWKEYEKHKNLTASHVRHYVMNADSAKVCRFFRKYQGFPMEKLSFRLS